jgi:hypothetical protein
MTPPELRSPRDKFTRDKAIRIARLSYQRNGISAERMANEHKEMRKSGLLFIADLVCEWPPPKPARTATKPSPARKARAKASRAKKSFAPDSANVGAVPQIGAPEGMVWVKPYTRKNGTQVRGYWRAKRCSKTPCVQPIALAA